MPTLRLALLAPAILCAAAAAQHRQPATLRPDAARWTLTLPADWEFAPDDVVQQLNAETQAKGIAITYIAGIRITDTSGPYALVQGVGPLPPGLTADQIRNLVGTGLAAGFDQAKEKLADSLSNVAAQSTSLDVQRAQLRARGTITNADGSKLELMSVAHFGTLQSVFIHCYAPPELFEQSLPRFEELNAGLAFDPGFQLIIAQTPQPTNSGLPVALIAGVAAAVTTGILVFIRQRKRAAPHA